MGVTGARGLAEEEMRESGKRKAPDRRGGLRETLGIEAGIKRTKITKAGGGRESPQWLGRAPLVFCMDKTHRRGQEICTVHQERLSPCPGSANSSRLVT